MHLSAASYDGQAVPPFVSLVPQPQAQQATTDCSIQSVTCLQSWQLNEQARNATRKLSKHCMTWQAITARDTVATGDVVHTCIAGSSPAP